MRTQDIEIVRRSSAFRFLSDEHFAVLEPLLREEHYDFGDTNVVFLFWMLAGIAIAVRRQLAPKEIP